MMVSSHFFSKKLFSILALVIGLSYSVFARARGPRVEVVCPFSPIPVKIAGDRVLAYELHVTNFDKVPLRMTRVDIYSDQQESQFSQSILAPDLLGIMVEVGANGAENQPDLIAPGRRAILFMWIKIALNKPFPQTLHHRIVFHSDNGSQASEDAGNAAVLNDFLVSVSRRAVPILNPPFHNGVWVAGDGPANDSPHRRSFLAIDGQVHAPERFASDWVKVGSNGDSKHGNSRNEDYWDFGEPVLAVTNGEVTDLKDGIADNVPHVPPKEITLDNILGNYVILKIAPSTFVTYAHLKNGSIQVALHQHIQQGVQIGLVGDTGQATAPHLHLEVTNGNSGLESEGIPFVFSHFTDLGPGTTYENDKHPSKPRQDILPQKDEVVAFPDTNKY